MVKGTVAVCTLLALEGCLGPRPDASAFYLLSPTPPSSQAAASAPVSIGVGPVSLPGYLDRPQIVVRRSDNEIVLSDSDRWAEPLEESVVRTLQEDLKGRLSGASFVRYPWFAGDAPDYAVAIEVRRFEADAAGAAVLDATWRISRGGTMVSGSDVRITEQADGADQAASVAALSRALGDLSTRIAAAIQRDAGAGR